MSLSDTWQNEPLMLKFLFISVRHPSFTSKYQPLEPQRQPELHTLRMRCSLDHIRSSCKWPLIRKIHMALGYGLVRARWRIRTWTKEETPQGKHSHLHPFRQKGTTKMTTSSAYSSKQATGHDWIGWFVCEWIFISNLVCVPSLVDYMWICFGFRC